MARLSPNSPLQLLRFLLLASALFVLLSSNVHAERISDGSQQNPLQLDWNDLIPEGFEPEALLKKYEKDLARLETLPDDSEEGFAIIKKIQAELDMIPTNSKLDGKWVQLPGYIAPLNIQKATIQQFLLVPYFGACIHVPPPPINQTVLVDTLPDQQIKLDESEYPYLITGKLSLQKTTTDIGSAGYHITEAKVKLHLDSRWLELEQ